jgi:hypothetical protein
VIGGLGRDRRGAARLALCLAATPMLMGAECEEPLVQDSGFDLWCGDSLCAWQVDEGAIAKVPTWHARDYGVDLQGAAARISQLLPSGSDDVSCLRLSLLADVADPVSVTLELDFNDDGGPPEHTETLPSGAWLPVSYHVSAPTYFRTVRVSIRKRGEGHAAVAQIQIAKSSGCSDPPLFTAQRPDGAPCESTAQCTTGRCLPQASAELLLSDPTKARAVCEACDADSECGAGRVCGLGFVADFVEPHRRCTPAAAGVLGDRCLTGGECAGGLCCRGVCSSCCAEPGAAAAAGCAAGQVCRERPLGPGMPLLRAAWQCAPGEGAGLSGAPCSSDGDCATGRCVGPATLTTCAADGRRCAGDADCPTTFLDNSCIAVGVAGGQCQ